LSTIRDREGVRGLSEQLPSSIEGSVSDNASLRLDRLARNFGKVRALDELSLGIPAGNFVTLLGPSGCGKSTTLNLIAGLDQPDGGSVYLGDRDITDVPPNERRMAMVFQNYALYPHMTAFDNIAFSLKLQRRPKDEIQRRVRQTAEMLDIGHLLQRKPGQLSGGQQQRVALGRALVKEPLVFLLDEPFSNLDAALRSRMRTKVKHLHLRLGTTSVFVTHDQEEAMTLSDLIAVMRDGKLVQFGTQHEVYRKPTNTYVATFVGKPKMSLIEGELEHHDESVDFVGQDIRINLGSPAAMGLADGEHGRVALGIRAEDVKIQLNGAGATDTPRAFGATVGLMEPIGSDTFVELAVGPTAIVARAAPDIDVALGQTVRADMAPGRIHLFDLETGNRIVD
jgi:multiple sugar transport system ATP-binding protein